MRTLPVLAFASLGLLLVAPAAANQAKPPANTRIELSGAGDQRTVTILGTQDCKFEVTATSSDESVAIVKFEAGKAKKSHKVVIESVAPGDADVTITTSNGTIPQCQGFAFSYPVAVELNEKAFQKEAKALFKESLQIGKEGGNELLDAYCVTLDEIAADAAGQVVSLEDAYFASCEALGDLTGRLKDFLDTLYDDTWVALWGDAAEFILSDPKVTALYPGGCGPWDDYRDSLNALEAKLKKASLKKHKALLKALQKAAQGDDDALLAVAEFPGQLRVLAEPVPLPGQDPMDAPPSAPPKPLLKLWTSAGRLSSSPMSRLEVGGQADPAAGDVTVAIQGPGGFNTSAMVMVDRNCKWTADFTGLSPGPYAVTLTQGANGPVSFTVQVP